MKRLEAIVSQINPCEFFADIGSDHGKIALFALKYVKKLIVTDISAQCLDKARQAFADVKADVIFSVGDGLQALGDHIQKVDCVAICGMGGRTICDILADYQGGARIILQAQNDLAFVRDFLQKRSFVILTDFLAYERGKFYDIMVVKHSDKPETLSQLQLNFGKFCFSPNELLKKRLLHEQKKYESYPSTDKNRQILEQIRTVLAFQNTKGEQI